MGWKKIERVQHVSALLCQNFDILPVLRRLKSGSKPYQDIEVSHGDGWYAFFGYEHPSGDMILPYIPNAVPFYQSSSKVWLPVGVAMNIAGSARENYLDEIREIHELGEREVFISPQFLGNAEKTIAADIFTVFQKLAVGQLVLETLL